MFKTTHSYPSIPAGAAADPYWDNVVLLMHMDSIPFVDETARHTISTVNSMAINSEIKQYGTASGDFNNGYLSIPHSADFDLQGESFTIECWINLTTTASFSNPILSTYQTASVGFEFEVYNQVVTVWLSGDVRDIIGTTIIQPNTWYHVAVSGSPGSYRLFVNGVQEGATYTKATSLNTTKPLSIGYWPAVGRKFPGYIDGLRITKGISRYNSTFTPTVPLL